MLAIAATVMMPLTATATVQHERFLLYDVVFHEQVNKQRRALMFYLDLAMKLKRTLVLPRTRLVRRIGRGSQFAPEAEYVSWGELFNVSALSKLHPVVELEQFVELHGPVSLQVKIDHKGCPESGTEDASFNGMRVAVLRSVCGAGVQYDVSRLLGSEMAGHSSIAFSRAVDQLQMGQALKLRPHVRFEEGIYSEAAAFVARQFGGQPFISIHWRRTDFLQVRASQPGVLQSAADLVAHVRRLQQLHGVKHVYLATDSDDERELAVVREALGPARYTPASPAVALRSRTILANVEIVVCAMAAHFLGTKTSSFTLAISEERAAIFGHAPSTTTEMGPLPSVAGAGTTPVQPSSAGKKDEAPGKKDEL